MIISSTYGNIPTELWVDIHEFGGCYLGETGFPGMNDTQVEIFNTDERELS